MKENNELERSDIKIGSDLDVDTENSTITAYIETWFDVDRKFGTHTAERDDEWVNLYAAYRPESGDLRMYYQVDRDDSSEFFEYAPTEGEKELVIAMMEELCQKEDGCSMKELYEKYDSDMTMGGM